MTCDSPRCAFCRQNPAAYPRVPTIYGAIDVCGVCLRHYRDQIAWAVEVVNLQHRECPSPHDHAA